MNSTHDDTPLDVNDQNRMELAEERLIANVRPVERGILRIRRQVEETPVSETVELHQEDVDIEHRDINEPADTVQLPHYDGDTLVIPVYEEVPVITKRLMLRKEIRVTKRFVDDAVQIEETLRRDTVELLWTDATDDAAQETTED